MHDHWKKFGPPAYVGIASAFGITTKKHQSGNLEDLAAQLSATGGRIV